MVLMMGLLFWEGEEWEVGIISFSLRGHGFLRQI